MNKKTWYWIGGGVLLVVLAWLWLRSRPAGQLVRNWEGPGYMTYNQPQAGAVTLPVAGYSSPQLTMPESTRSCGCNPAVSAYMAQGADMLGNLSSQLNEQLSNYANSLNDYLASQMGA